MIYLFIVITINIVALRWAWLVVGWVGRLEGFGVKARSVCAEFEDSELKVAYWVNVSDNADVSWPGSSQIKGH